MLFTTPEDRFSRNWSLNKDKESILFFCCKMDSSGTVEMLNSAVLCLTALFDRMLGINGLMNLYCIEVSVLNLMFKFSCIVHLKNTKQRS